MRCFQTFTVILVAALLPARAQSFYEANDLLPPHVPDIALGATVVDVNSDGRVDLFRRDRLFLQEMDGTFTDVYEDLGFTPLGGASFGAMFGDTNNDGFLEAFFMDLDESLPFFIGRDGLYFEEHSNDSGIRDVEIVQGSAWIDFNRDGLLDLFVGIDGGSPRLYRNVGLDFFQNVAPLSGFEYQYAYGVAAADYDRDGDPDIMLTQCFPPPENTLIQNILYRNDDGVFVSVSDDLGIVDDLPSWGVVWLDYDNDGLLDFYVGNANQGLVANSGENTLYRNLGTSGFEDVTASAGVAGSADGWSIAVAAADFDNDGWVDIFVVESKEGQPSLYHNNADGTFSNVWPQLALPTVNSLAVAVGDVNEDGWIDIFQPYDLGNQLLLNRGGSNRFLSISLRGTVSNHYGVGGRIDLYAAGLHQVREITAGDGLTSQNHNLSAHFGLGSATVVDSIVVSWPSGATDRLSNIQVDRSVTIVEGVGIDDPPSAFALLNPVRKSALSPSDDILEFTWERSLDTDEITYSVRIAGGDLDTTATGLTAESFAIDRSFFNAGQQYRWTVSAADGHSVRAARYAEFVFGPTTAVESGTDLPDQVNQLHVFPNPFHNMATIEIELARQDDIQIEVFDIAGRRIAAIHDGLTVAGKNRFDWSPAEAADGTYLLRIASKSWLVTRRIVLR